MCVPLFFTTDQNLVPKSQNQVEEGEQTKLPGFLASPFSVACAVRHSNGVENWSDECGLGPLSNVQT